MAPRRTRKGMTEERRKRAVRVLGMRREGATYQQIAKEEGISVSTAFEDVDKALKEITREPAESVLRLELERLDGMYFRLSTQISRLNRQISGDQGRGEVDLPAIEMIRKLINTQISVSERRAKLLGMDTQHHEHSIDPAIAIQEAFGTIVAVSEDELMGQIGEEV